MGNKKLILGITVLVIVAAIFIVADKMTAIRPPEHRMKFFPALEERHVNAFVVSNNGNRTRIERCPCGWKVGNDGDSLVKADSMLARIAVERIVSLRKSDVASNNPANREKFEVGDDAASYVEIYTDTTAAPAGVLLFGKSGPEWNSNYVRLKGSDDVYLMSGMLRQVLFLDLEQWRKKEGPKPEPEEDIDADDAVNTETTD